MSKKKYLVPLITIVLLGVILGRGVLIYPLLPGIASLFYTNSLDNRLEEERHKLQAVYPFGKIMFITKHPVTCDLLKPEHTGYDITEIGCSNYLFRGQVSIKGMTLQEFQAKITYVERALEKDRWKIQDSHNLVLNYGEPLGWFYLAQYEKYIGKTLCDLSIERDNDPQFLNANIGCGQRVKLF